MGCTSSNPASVKPISTGFRPSEADSGYKQRPIAHTEIPCGATNTEADVSEHTMDNNKIAADQQQNHVDSLTAEKKRLRESRPQKAEEATTKTPERQFDSPSTTAESTTPSPPSAGNQIIDPGMFITQQRGSLGERYHRDKKLGSGAYGEVS